MSKARRIGGCIGTGRAKGRPGSQKESGSAEYQRQKQEPGVVQRSWPEYAEASSERRQAQLKETEEVRGPADGVETKLEEQEYKLREKTTAWGWSLGAGRRTG